MEITSNNIILYIAIVFTGLSAGLFYAWKFSVIPGTKRIDDLAYIKTMQEINRAIINPAFMLIFLGSILVQAISIYQLREKASFWLLSAAFIAYFGGTVLVTILGNVPLNNALDSVKTDKLDPEQLGINRNRYETRWNKLHSIRTYFAVLSFVLLLTGLYYTN